MPGVRFPVSEFFLFGFSEKVTSKGFLKTVQSVRYGVVGNISAGHADARGSIPRDGVLPKTNNIPFGRNPCARAGLARNGVLAQSEACVLSKDEVLGSKPRYSIFVFVSVGMV